jgi:hypothetical protein
MPIASHQNDETVAETPQMNIRINGRQLASAIVLVVILFVGYAGVLTYYDLVSFSIKSIYVSIPMLGGLVGTIIFGALASGEAPWSKQGNDLNLLTFGAILSTLALQIAESAKSVLPGFEHSPLWTQFLTDMNLGDRPAVFVLLALALVLSVVFCLISSIIEGSIHAEPKKNKPGKALLNCIMGILSFGFYATIVCGSV